jgi:uncharacterized membrane protein
MDELNKIEELTDRAKKYLDTHIELLKLEVTERISVIGSGMVSVILVSFVFILFVLFLSLWAGFYFSACLGNSYAGFGIVAGFYFLLVLLFVFARKNLLETPIRNSVIRSVFNKHK